jgi:hypothetical protein
MIRRSTWIVIALLAIVIGAYFVIKNRPPTATPPTPTVLANSFLITIGSDKLQSIRISDLANSTTLVERDSASNWQVALPAPGPADQGLAEAAETQVGAMRIVTTLETSPDLGAIGLDHPAYTIDLTFQSGAKHTVEVGSSTPTGGGYYVRFDQKTILVISQDGIDPLVALLANPPYVATATPVETSTATLEPSATAPEATATP